MCNNYIKLTPYYLQDKSTGPVTKEDLGRATWTFLHTLAAQVEFCFVFFNLIILDYLSLHKI